MSSEEPGLRSIGSLTPKIADTLKTVISTRTMSPEAFATFGSARRERTPARSTGTLPGVTGAATNLPAILAGNNPETTDRVLLASLERQLGQPLTLLAEDFIDAKYGYDRRTLGYELAAPVDVDCLQAARCLVADALLPARPELIVQELARLRMLTKSRAGDEVDREAAYVALAEELLEFPPDVVRGAVRQIARTSPFFPALVEIYQACTDAVHHRRLLARALGLYAEDPA